MLAYKLTLIFSILAFMWIVDIYSWQGVKTVLQKRKNTHIKRIKYFYFGVAILLSILLVLSFASAKLETNMLYRTYVSSFIFIIYLSKFFLCIFLLIDDLIRGFKWIFSSFKTAKQQEPVIAESDKISRAKFISQAGTLTAGAPLILLSKGIFKGAYDYRIHRVPLYLKNLPFAFEGLKIVQLSDIHTGSLLDKDSVHKGIQMTMQEKPDLVFFTGDFVNNTTAEAYPLMDHFAQIKAPMGVHSILGNHDYGDYARWESKEAKQKNLTDLYAVHRDMGWNLLRNENITIDKGGSKIGLIGVENWGSKGRFQRIGDLNIAMKNMEDVPVKLLLSHDPSHFDNIISTLHPDIDATFSGHTHGFQFGIENAFIKWSPSQYIYPRWAGLYKEGKQQLYVNRGYGFLGYPGRVGIMPEITVFELRRA